MKIFMNFNIQTSVLVGAIYPSIDMHRYHRNQVSYHILLINSMLFCLFVEKTSDPDYIG